MFTKSLVAAFGFASIALGTPTRRFEHITVDVVAPDAVDSVDGLKFTASVKNIGTEAVKILKYNTILDDLPTRSFTVTKDGAEAAFTGIKLSVSLDQEYEAGNYVTIPAGESVTVSHDVSKIFDYETLGAGAYSFAPITTFHIAGASDVATAKTLAKVPVAASAFVVNVKGDVSKRSLAARSEEDIQERSVIDKRATVSCSSSSQKSFITSSYTEGKALASGAASYISTNGANSLYTAYWGASSTSTVRGVFTTVANEASSSRTLSCSDPYGACTSGVIAYTLIATTNIYFCSIFYNEVATTSLCSGTSVASRNIRGGTTLHELTHATSGTDDVTYGCAADQALSDANSRINADNYNCFSTQVYANTKC